MHFDKKSSIRRIGAGSPVLKLFNNSNDWKKFVEIPASEDDKPLTAGKIDNHLRIQGNRKEIQAFKYTAPMICCHHWEVGLLDSQEIIVKYCTGEDLISVHIKRDFRNDFSYVPDLAVALHRISEGKSADQAIVEDVQMNLVAYLQKLKQENSISYFETIESNSCCKTWRLKLSDSKEILLNYWGENGVCTLQMSKKAGSRKFRREFEYKVVAISQGESV